MGASRLRQIARVLELPVEFFYDGAPSQSKYFRPILFEPTAEMRKRARSTYQRSALRLLPRCRASTPIGSSLRCGEQMFIGTPKGRKRRPSARRAKIDVSRGSP
jgi:hypothetical protein